MRAVGAGFVVLLAIVLATALPWLGLATAGLLSTASLTMAAPSPAYVVVMMEAVAHDTVTAPERVTAGWIAIAAWCALGAALSVAGLRALRTAASAPSGTSGRGV